MQEIKVEKIIIGKQYEECENYQKFKQIILEKNIKVNIVEEGKRINIEKDLYFDILWPLKENTINDNIINNNSLVCKLVYKDFSMIFTGDIEEIAEKLIVSKYNKNVLKSYILKVAHHGSKTSSIKELINAVNPQYAVIGVGKNNKFGHPADSTIKNLEEQNVKIYRTDENGEIFFSIFSNRFY